MLYLVCIKLLNSDFSGKRRKWPTRQMGIRHYRSNTLDMSRRPSAELMPPASHRGCFPARWARAAAQSNHPARGEYLGYHNIIFLCFFRRPKSTMMKPNMVGKQDQEKEFKLYVKYLQLPMRPSTILQSPTSTIRTTIYVT